MRWIEPTALIINQSSLPHSDWPNSKHSIDPAPHCLISSSEASSLEEWMYWLILSQSHKTSVFVSIICRLCGEGQYSGGNLPQCWMYPLKGTYACMYTYTVHVQLCGYCYDEVLCTHCHHMYFNSYVTCLLLIHDTKTAYMYSNPFAQCWTTSIVDLLTFHLPTGTVEQLSLLPHGPGGLCQERHWYWLTQPQSAQHDETERGGCQTTNIGDRNTIEKE